MAMYRFWPDPLVVAADVDATRFVRYFPINLDWLHRFFSSFTDKAISYVHFDTMVSVLVPNNYTHVYVQHAPQYVAVVFFSSLVAALMMFIILKMCVDSGEREEKKIVCVLGYSVSIKFGCSIEVFYAVRGLHLFECARFFFCSLFASLHTERVLAAFFSPARSLPFQLMMLLHGAR